MSQHEDASPTIANNDRTPPRPIMHNSGTPSTFFRGALQPLPPPTPSSFYPDAVMMHNGWTPQPFHRGALPPPPTASPFHPDAPSPLYRNALSTLPLGPPMQRPTVHNGWTAPQNGWTAPQEVYVKINYGAAYYGEVCWTISVARTTHGSILAIQVDTHRRVSSRTMASAKALREAVHLALEYKWRRCVFESDSASALHCLFHGADYGDSAFLLNTIKQLIPTDGSCRFFSTPSSSNWLVYNILNYCNQYNIRGRVNPSIFPEQVLSHTSFTFRV